MSKEATLYRYIWGNNTKRATLKGRFCFILARGRMNSVLVLFLNGQREIVSRYALRVVEAGNPYGRTAA